MTTGSERPRGDPSDNSDPTSFRKGSWTTLGSGLLLVAINAVEILRHGKYYPLMMFITPMVILMGVAGLLFPPRVLPNGEQKSYPEVWLAVVVAGSVIGFILAYDPAGVIHGLGLLAR